MKFTKSALALIIVTLFSLSLFACTPTCKTHADENGDGICENCKKEAEPEIALIKNSEAEFCIVKGESLPIEVTAAINDLVKLLGEFGINIEILTGEDNERRDICEILVGSVATREEKYIVDGHDYGIDGYAIKMIDNKIAIVGGSDESLLSAFKIFTKSILKLDKDDDSLDDASMKKSDEREQKSEGYDIESISVGGTDLKGYTIATDTESGIYYNGALAIQEKIYNLSGYYLKIVPLSDAGERSIIIRSVPRDDSGEDSFRAYVSGITLFIDCEYDNKLSDTLALFIKNVFSDAKGALMLSGNVFTDDISTVAYEDFGAKGDGKTNDYKAIKEAHEFANISGQTVVGRANATYYISSTIFGAEAQEIPIKTNVDWNGAKIVIDDRDIRQAANNVHSTHVFKIISDVSALTATAKKNTEIYNILSEMAESGRLGPQTEKIDLNLGYSAMIILTNSTKKVYIRYGKNADSGDSQSELIVIDRDGNIDPKTKLLLDYDALTSAYVYNLEIEPITIKNAEITTRASRMDTIENGKRYDEYFKRGILVSRSGTTLENIKHYVTDEFTPDEQAAGLTGPAYSGFFFVQNASDVTIKSCILTGRRYYNDGTYDFGARFANNILLIDCKQSNFYRDGTTILSTSNDKTTGKSFCWGVGGTNYCKNMTYLRCELTRFDAHSGLYNGAVIDSHVAMINLIGGGEMLIENTVVEDDVIFQLRQDYGATWKGTVTIRDCTAKYTSGSEYNLCYLLWSNHDFGYTCHFPNIIVDNFKTTANHTRINLVKYATSSDANQETLHTSEILHIPGATFLGGATNINPYAPPEFLIAVNSPDLTFTVVENPFFDNTKLRGFVYEYQNSDERVDYDPTVDTEYPDYREK